MLAGGNVFAPEVGLQAEDVGGLLRFDAVHHRVESIDVAERYQRPAGRGFLADKVLVIIEIAVRIGRHNHVVPGGDGFLSALDPAPGLNGGMGGNAGFQDFVPADDATSPGPGVGIDVADQITLEFMDVLHAFLPHLFLAVDAVFPVIHDGLIAADMDKLRGEEVKYLVQDAFQETEGLFPSRAEVPGEGVQLAVGALAGPFRIGPVYFQAVAGHFDLRNDGDVPLGSVPDDFPDILMGVKASVGLGVVLACEGIAAFFPGEIALSDAPGYAVGQVGKGMYLQAPAGCVRQVEVQDVQFEQGHRVHLLEQKRLSLEAAGFVYHEPPVAETRPVEDLAAGEDVLFVHPGKGLELGQGLPGSEFSGRGKGADSDVPGCYRELVRLFFGEIGEGGCPASQGSAGTLHLDGRVYGAGALGKAIGHGSGHDVLRPYGGVGRSRQVHQNGCQKAFY